VSANFYGRIAELEREHASFAIATVVARQAPVSSHLGDRALVFTDGRMEGFVGGSCSRDIVRRQALRAIRMRQPVLLQIRPDAREEPTGEAAVSESGELPVPATERVIIPMSCSSEGAVDVYIEPRVPLRRLVVAGFTPVAEAVARIAAALDYNVVRVVVEDEMRDLAPTGERTLSLGALRAFLAGLDERERETLVAIVASQGHYDELALEVLQAYDLAFIGLLASRRRAATVLGVLAQQGVPADRLALIRYPVGLAIGARNPGEVAVSILAEIIGHASSVTPIASETSAISFADPVCGMDVDPASALYSSEHADRTYYFCCAGCRVSFEAEPARYLTAGSA
jgi:xanthine dehydrogenase accessory factor